MLAQLPPNVVNHSSFPYLPFFFFLKSRDMYPKFSTLGNYMYIHIHVGGFVFCISVHADRYVCTGKGVPPRLGIWLQKTNLPRGLVQNYQLLVFQEWESDMLQYFSTTMYTLEILRGVEINLRGGKSLRSPPSKYFHINTSSFNTSYVEFLTVSYIVLYVNPTGLWGTKCTEFNTTTRLLRLFSRRQSTLTPFSLSLSFTLMGGGK